MKISNKVKQAIYGRYINGIEEYVIARELGLAGHVVAEVIRGFTLPTKAADMKQDSRFKS